MHPPLGATCRYFVVLCGRLEVFSDALVAIDVHKRPIRRLGSSCAEGPSSRAEAATDHDA